jgi:hypothetical protein
MIEAYYKFINISESLLRTGLLEDTVAEVVKALGFTGLNRAYL